MKKELLFTILIEAFYSFYLGITIIFGVIFFYEFFSDNLFLALLPYAVFYLYDACLFPASAKLIGKIGVRNSLAVALIMFAVTPFFIYKFEQERSLFYLLVWFWAFFTAKLMYHPAISYLFGTLTTQKARGKEFALKEMIIIPLALLTPLVGGYLSETSGFLGVVLFASFLMIIALGPLMFIRNYKYQLRLSFKKQFFSRVGKEMLHYNFFFELQSAAIRVWPLYIFFILDESFTLLGSLLAVTTGLSIFLAYVFGRILDRGNRKRIFSRILQFSGFSWFLRLLSFNYATILIADVISNFLKLVSVEALNTINNDLINHNVAKDGQDERVVIKEVITNLSVSFGVFVMGLIGEYLGLNYALLFAAIVGSLIFPLNTRIFTKG